jgi:ATP-dependent Clp protease ATP-binding subunit ClpA
MNLNIPIYVESTREADHKTVYTARPLFFSGPCVRAEKLDRLMTHLAQELGQHLSRLGREARHDELTGCTFHPVFRQEKHELRFSLRRHTARCRFLFVSFRQFGRSVAFTPSVPGVWFDVARSEQLADRAREVLTSYFKKREHEDADFSLNGVGVTGTSYVTPLEISIRSPVLPPEPTLDRFLCIGDAEVVDGATELRRVGRCLDWLYPDELDRVELRETEVAELGRLLKEAEQRPVLLVGPRMVGKTALVHEHVYRQVSQHASPFLDRKNVWLLSPARLISGMSYVGQWENRLLAILKEARRRDHVLYFDDLLGLFLAGKTGQGSLSVADVLKQYLERREVRVVAEITPEGLRVLREQDRGFADLFHLLPLSEPDESATLRILIAVQRQLESQQRCRFALDVLPTVLDLQHRYGRDTAFPGKAASFLRRLAVKFRGQDVTRDAALGEFHQQSGLALDFLKREVRLELSTVLEALAKLVMGQRPALEAAARVIAIAKARLNDPDRPLASFLFLGPTGVGKTQCAKALATYLFGGEERLLRIDLNEYGEPGATARLVGTFNQPEGLLTNAIRRQPFAVVLFDEFEKAHPEVFDLLLQILGEGRLSDSLGRTADFTNALVVLTSNLGVREAESQLGFQPDARASEAAYIRVVERFLRPELFNRLDHVIPFRRLARDEIRDIARKLLGDVLGREGLVQRKIILNVEERALEWLVDQGYDPHLGARALKRAMERHLTQPLAEQLAGQPPAGFTAISVYAGPQQLAVRASAIEEAVPSRPALMPLSDPKEVTARVRATLLDFEEGLTALRPVGPITLGQVQPEHYRYFSVREQMDRVQALTRSLDEKVDAAQRRKRSHPSYWRDDRARPPKVYKLASRRFERRILRELAAALNINEYMRDLVETAVPGDAKGEFSEDLHHLLSQVALLNTMIDCLRTRPPDRVLLWMRNRPLEGARILTGLRGLCLEGAFLKLEDRQRSDESFLLIHGLHAWPIAQLEAGTQLFLESHSRPQALQILVLPVPEETTPEAAVLGMERQRQEWLDRVHAGTGGPADDPWRLGPVVRIQQGERIVHLPTGLVNAAFPDDLLATLPLPARLCAEDAS